MGKTGRGKGVLLAIKRIEDQGKGGGDGGDNGGIEE